MKKLGLIGYPLSHSFSKGYFTKKFLQEGLESYNYDNYEIEKIQFFKNIIHSDPSIIGLNVTIPYKEQVIAFLDEIDPEAEKIGAVNTVKILNGKTKGYNTDVYGLEQTLRKLLGGNFLHSNEVEEQDINEDNATIKALILGTGGAAKATAYVVTKLGIPYKLVSRSMSKGELTYQDIDAAILTEHQLLINTTPLGMSPKVDNAPDIPYNHLSDKHFLYDLIYNPEKTLFLQQGEAQGAKIANGLELLHLQAERAWEIWTNDD